VHRIHSRENIQFYKLWRLFYHSEHHTCPQEKEKQGLTKMDARGVPSDQRRRKTQVDEGRHVVARHPVLVSVPVAMLIGGAVQQ
jgi:hypothetical protein